MTSFEDQTAIQYVRFHSIDQLIDRPSIPKIQSFDDKAHLLTYILVQWVYVAEILFAITITLVQLSFCFFYSRIFTLVSRKFTIALYTCGGLAIVVGLVNLFPTIFQCSPVAFAYDKSIPGGKCIQQRIMFVVEDVLLLVVDLFVVALPLPMIWGLQMPRAEKVAISGMFLLGGLYVYVFVKFPPRLCSSVHPPIHLNTPHSS